MEAAKGFSGQRGRSPASPARGTGPRADHAAARAGTGAASLPRAGYSAFSVSRCLAASIRNGFTEVPGEQIPANLSTPQTEVRKRPHTSQNPFASGNAEAQRGRRRGAGCVPGWKGSILFPGNY